MGKSIATLSDWGCNTGITLTHKEKEVLDLLIKGLSDKEIAIDLGVKITTIRTHIGSIFGKFDVSDRKRLIIKILLKNNNTSYM